MPNPRRPDSERIETLQITLRGIEPAVWRRIQIPRSMTLDRLHLVLQDAFGWSNSHLHAFYIDGTEYGITDPNDPFNEDKNTVDETGIKLDEILKFQTYGFWYRYDFGDDWIHEVQMIDDFTPRPDGTVFPRCLAGARSAPPEDCGGWHGYARLVEVLSDPKHEEYKDMRTWVGRRFDPERCDVDAINAALKKHARTAPLLKVVKPT